MKKEIDNFRTARRSLLSLYKDHGWNRKRIISRDKSIDTTTRKKVIIEPKASQTRKTRRTMKVLNESKNAFDLMFSDITISPNIKISKYKKNLKYQNIHMLYKMPKCKRNDHSLLLISLKSFRMAFLGLLSKLLPLWLLQDGILINVNPPRICTSTLSQYFFRTLFWACFKGKKPVDSPALVV